MKRFFKHALWIIPVLAIIGVTIFYIYCDMDRTLKDTLTFCSTEGETLVVDIDLEYDYFGYAKGTVTYGDMTVDAYSQKEFKLLPDMDTFWFTFWKSTQANAFAESIYLHLHIIDGEYLYQISVSSDYLGTERTVDENGNGVARPYLGFAPAQTGEEALQVARKIYAPESE